MMELSRRSQGEEKPADRLKDIFKEFSSDKEKFVELLHATRKVADEIQAHLTRNVDDKRFKENITSLLKDSEEVDQVLTQEPSIIVIGQTKSGKSSFINELLEGTVVAADQRPCTARMTILQHIDETKNEEPSVTVVSQSGKELKSQKLVKKYIPRDWVNLPFEQRENKEEVYAKVIAKVRNDFLKSGVKIIDSPGRNENSLLDDLVMDHMKTILPLVIYVIDGKQRLTLRDKEDIQAVLALTLPENIFFVVTKIDAREDDDSDSSSDESDSDSDSDQEEEETENLKTVYRQLCKENIVDERVTMKDCPRFHGLSSWKIKTQRKEDTEPNRYTEAFDHFKNCLVEFTQKQLQYHIDSAAQSLADNHRICIDVFIDEANRIYDERQSYRNVVECAERKERNLYDDIDKKIRDDAAKLEAVVRACLSLETCNKIKKDASVHKYTPYRKKRRDSVAETLPDGADASATIDGRNVYGIEETDVIEITIPEDGFASNRDLVQECRRQIQQFVYDRLGNSLSKKISTHFMEGDGVLNQVWEDLSSLKLEDAEGESATVESLKGMMIKNYKFEPKKEHFEEKLRMKIKIALRNLLHRFISLFRGEMGRTGVGKGEWKEQIAGDALEQISATRIKDGVIQELLNHIKSGHESFRREIKMMKEVYQKQLELGDTARREIRACTPRIASLELRALDLIDRHIYGVPECQRQLGIGMQGMVHSTNARGLGGEKLAMKRITGRTHGRPSADPLERIATEVHHLRQLNHPNLAKLHGCVILGESRNQISVPFTEIGMLIEEMRGDLLEWLPSYNSMNTRLKMALQIGHAVRYLHDKKMIHRDIKPANVLLGENGRVVLTDFGCCKPLGLMSKTMTGTPIHMAPEMLSKGEREYDEKVDVYAFGVFLWYCAEGTGKHPIDTTVEDGVGAVFENTRMGRRPPQEPHFDGGLWELMTKCWEEKPGARPDMKEVCLRLEGLVEN